MMDYFIYHKYSPPLVQKDGILFLRVLLSRIFVINAEWTKKVTNNKSTFWLTNRLG